MNVFELTRALVDIESITNNEERVGEYLLRLPLPRSPPRTAGASSAWRWSRAASTSSRSWASRRWSRFPPTWIRCRRSSPRARTTNHIWGRAACDTKGIIASMIKAGGGAAGGGRAQFRPAVRGGRGAQQRRRLQGGAGSRAARASSSTASRRRTSWPSAPRARCATRSWPRAGWRTRPTRSWANRPSTNCSTRWSDSARIPLPVDEMLGPSTLNIGTLDRRARAQHHPRRGAGRDPDPAGGRFGGRPSAPCSKLPWRAAPKLREVLEIPAVRLGSLDGIETTVVAYTTDIPAFGGTWGKPFLLGPGTIHVAHTLEERVPKRQLLEAVEIYQRMVRQLCKRRIESRHQWIWAPPEWWASISSSFCRATRGST